MVNSPGFVPPRETFESVRGPLPVFVTVTVWAGLVAPTIVGWNRGGTEKLIEFEESCRVGVKMPFPVRAMVCVPPTLSEKDSVAVRTPELPGVNVRATAHVPPDPITFMWPAVPHVVLASRAKSAAFVPLTGDTGIVTVMGPLPALIKNTESGRDFLATVWFPKSSVVVETLTTAGSPTPLSGT